MNTKTGNQPSVMDAGQFPSARLGHGLWKGAVTLSIALGFSAGAQAQISGDVVRIGVLTDMEGVFSESTGAGSVLAAKMAVEDFGGTVAGKKIEVISADHQNKPDVASTVSRGWYDNQGVDLIVDAIGSPVGLAVQEIARERKKMLIVDGVTTPRFTGEACSETGFMWVFSAYTNAKALAQGGVESVGKNWYFLAYDNAGGQGIVQSVTPFVTQFGGKIVGESKFPLNQTDFSSQLLQAQASKANAVVIAASGAPVVSILKQAREFRTMAAGGKFVLPFTYISEIHALGLENAQGALLSEPFYWAMNDESKAWSKRFFAQRKAMPTTIHAGIYTSILHYLKAIEKVKTDDGLKVAGAMRELPINDFMTKNGKIRIDGDVDRQRQVYEVKAPKESKEPYDYYKVVRSFGLGETIRPLGNTGCPLVKQ